MGTVDQAMLAGLMAKHAHMRGSALSRSLLVVDEVHASDRCPPFADAKAAPYPPFGFGATC